MSKSYIFVKSKMVVNVINPQKTITTAKSKKGEMIIIAEIEGDKMISVYKIWESLNSRYIFIFKKAVF